MISQTLVDNIRKHGSYQKSAERRSKVLKDSGFKIGQKAEYVFIPGCGYPELVPHVFRALRELMDSFGISYTLLSREYCCGAILAQAAIRAGDAEEIAKVNAFSREFILENFKQAKELGAKSIVFFCPGCEHYYDNLAGETDLEVISYYELLDRYFKGGRLDLEADYYAGCFRFRRKLTQKPVDIEPARRVLERIIGLRLDLLDNNLC